MAYDFGTTIEFPQETIEWMVVWRCFLDACPKCQNLNGYPFNGFGELPDVLTHPQWGPVWDIIGNQSLTHPNCRCSIQPYLRVDFNKIPYMLEFSQRLDIPNLEVEMVELTDIRELRDAVRDLKGDMNEFSATTYETEIVMRRYLALARRLGLPEDMNQAITAAQSMRYSTMMMYRGIEAIDLYGGMIGTAMFAGGTALAGVGVADFLARRGQQTTADIRSQIAKEQQHNLEVAQMALRRQRY